MLTDPVSENGIVFSTISLNVDGGGTVRGSNVYFLSENITVDANGVISADGLGYEVTDGGSTSIHLGRNGQVNPGGGFVYGKIGSGAGHGGSGGHGKGFVFCFCFNIFTENYP